jgi:hypothetical protein
MFAGMVEHAHPAPAHKTVIQRLGRAIAARRILPLQAVLDNINDPADHAQIVPPRYAVGQRKIRFYAVKLSLRQHEQVTHRGCVATL